MLRINHITWTISLSLFLYSYLFELNLFYTILLSLITGYFSSIPDIDIKIIKKLKKIDKKYFYLTIPFTILPRIIFRHRTITHSLFLPIIISTFSEIYIKNNILLYISRIFYIAIILHIFEDAFTKAGVKMFFPFQINIRFFKFSTQSKLDFLILQYTSFGILILFFIVKLGIKI